MVLQGPQGSPRPGGHSSQPPTPFWRRRIAVAHSAVQSIRAQYHQHPGWTCQLHLRQPEGHPRRGRRTVLYDTSPLPACPRDVSRTQAESYEHRRDARDRLEKLEVRSFKVEHVNALWHLDFHHGSRKLLTLDGQWITPTLLCVLNDRSRVVCHAQWLLDETARGLIHGLCQAFQRRGLPRALMTNNGVAMLAVETTAGLHTLGVLHQKTLPYSPHRNAKQETFWARIEGRVMAMLEGEPNLKLELLNQATHA